MDCGPDWPASTGTESVHSLGGLWTVGHGANGGMQSRMTLGYDPKAKRFVGSFVADCMTHHWTYDGALEADGQRLVMSAVGPSMANDGTMNDYQDIFEFQSDDVRTLTSKIKQPDGSWKQFMQATYTRTAPGIVPPAATVGAAITPYLFFGGRTEEAIRFYAEALNGKLEMLMRFKHSPDPVPEGMIPPGYDDKVMHASMTIHGVRVMMSDGCEPTTKFGGFSLALSLPTEADCHAAYNALADGGVATMPLGKTFWSACYGMVTDRFGVNWMVSLPV
jgi:PhnB protein